MITRVPRLLLASALAAALLITGCSDDDNETTSTTDVEVSAEYEALCAAARTATTASSSELLAAAEAQVAAAPDEVKADFEAVLELVQYRADNPTDAAGIADKEAETAAALARAVDTIQRECGFNPFRA